MEFFLTHHSIICKKPGKISLEYNVHDHNHQCHEIYHMHNSALNINYKILRVQFNPASSYTFISLNNDVLYTLKKAQYPITQFKRILLK